jgi:hypothetical protein
MIDTAGSGTSTQNQYIWLNVGPDIRFNTSNHLTLDFAYTVRRGLKIGAAYIF